MNESRVGERGASVLGALVLALMLGTGAVVTFELAAPSPSAVSQTGASGVLALDAKKTATDEKAKQEQARKEAIKKKCDEMKKSLAKAKVGESTKHAPKTFENNVDPVEPSRCVGAIKIS